MKKLFIGLGIAVAMLAACGDDEADTKKGDSEQGIAVDKGLLEVEYILYWFVKRIRLAIVWQV